MKRFIALLLGLASLITAHASVQSTAVLEHIPVLDGGRVMPLDSYARHTLLLLSGKSTYQGQSATHWMGNVLFDPDSTETNEIFLVNNPEVVEALGLSAEGRSRYSYTQFKPHLQELSRLAKAAWDLAEDARSPVEKEIIRLHHTVGLYASLSRSLDFVTEREEFAIADQTLRKDLDLPPGDSAITYFDIAQRTEALGRLLEKHRETPRDQWTPYQANLFRLAGFYNAWSQESHEGPPNLLPIPGHNAKMWIGPWLAADMAPQNEVLKKEIGALADMGRAWRDGKQVDFDIAARTFVSSVLKRAPDPTQVANLKMEVRYNKSEAFYRAEIIYGFAFLAALAGLAIQRRWLYLTAVGLTALAMLPHTYGIVSRMIIMGRPPVTNLYATFLFVAWVCVLLGLATEYFQRNRLGLIVAAASGLALLMVSGRFAEDGDTMGVMIAVLDSNFWLATHVVCISIGYAGCCVAGLVGHIYLLQNLRYEQGHPVLRETVAALYGTLGFGLIFSFFGTMLGGVWADQSWGRFWGWDPKENGALVIVLWSAILFHARACGMVGPRGFAAGAVLGVIGVLMAWLGVNLLGVGLHSYGFTSGLLRGFITACSVEVLFVALTVPFCKVRRIKNPAV